MLSHMTYHCQALAVHCLDFRIQKAIQDYLEKKGLLGNCDIVSVAGGVKTAVNPGHDFILNQIRISKRLHDIKEIILINHTDCGAYDGDDEKSLSDLQKTKTLLQGIFGGVEIKMALAKIAPTSEVAVADL